MPVKKSGSHPLGSPFARPVENEIYDCIKGENVPYAMLDRDSLSIKSLKDRYSKVNIERDHRTGYSP